MNQDGSSRKSKRVKNSNFIPPGSVASLLSQRVLNHRHKPNSKYISDVHVTKSNEKHYKHKQNSNYIPAGSEVEQVQQVCPDSIYPAAQTIHEQVLLDSTTAESGEAQEQVRQTSQLSSIPALQAVNEQIQQDPQDSTNLEANDQSGEGGPSTQKRKRGGTQMQSVHGRSERKLIVLNELHQPIGPTEAIVKELGSFLGTLARNGTFCPLNVLK
ncbi:uncharacterized protein LOC132626403 [Lycium barbarum]|uniref:uncharacterized protein LOC132626403 n=1 Tax=Lycium barbarum TaxID=112863 RepID=UPI00293F4BE7|nr:uncharacterized protein LOC132626403 [Lycium barbarum]XP_060197248.1 uncharacterized protein LOC132626403 [Lycium barbarum]